MGDGAKLAFGALACALVLFGLGAMVGCAAGTQVSGGQNGTELVHVATTPEGVKVYRVFDYVGRAYFAVDKNGNVAPAAGGK